MRQFWSSAANLSDLRNVAGVGFKRTNVDNTEFQQQHLKLSRNLWTRLPSLEDIVLCFASCLFEERCSGDSASLCHSFSIFQIHDLPSKPTWKRIHKCSSLRWSSSLWRAPAERHQPQPLSHIPSCGNRVEDFQQLLQSLGNGR